MDVDEKASRERRATRLSHLLQMLPDIPQGTFFCGGEVGLKMFDEVRLSYIHGLDLATVLLTLSFVEREIAGRLYGEGWNPAPSARLDSLLSKANECRLLSKEELTTFQNLRHVRNAYVHFRTPLHRTSFERRAVDENELPHDILENDARKAIEALGSFILRQCSVI